MGEDRLGHLFHFLDIDGNGKLTQSEFTNCFRDECVKAYFAALHLESVHPEKFFQLIDVKERGWIERHDFVKACLCFGGSVKPLEIAFVDRALKSQATYLEMLRREFEFSMNIL